MLTIFAILWLLIWALTVFDLFRRDWSVLRKALWAVGMLIFPVVGVIAYFIVRPPAASDVDAGAASRDAPEERMHDRHPV
jgi:Phospholipase_D-nuclease N-terminal